MSLFTFMPVKSKQMSTATKKDDSLHQFFRGEKLFPFDWDCYKKRGQTSAGENDLLKALPQKTLCCLSCYVIFDNELFTRITRDRFRIISGEIL